MNVQQMAIHNGVRSHEENHNKDTLNSFPFGIVMFGEETLFNCML